MPASVAELAVTGGLPRLLCPVSGVEVIGEEGFDPDSQHSPYLRFFIDWVGNHYAADPSTLPESQADHQARIIDLLEAESWGSQNELVDALAEAMGSSGLILEVLDPPVGSFQGEICCAGFDFAPAEDLRPVQLMSL